MASPSAPGSEPPGTDPALPGPPLHSPEAKRRYLWSLLGAAVLLLALDPIAHALHLGASMRFENAIDLVGDFFGLIAGVGFLAGAWVFGDTLQFYAGLAFLADGLDDILYQLVLSRTVGGFVSIRIIESNPVLDAAEGIIVAAILAAGAVISGRRGTKPVPHRRYLVWILAAVAAMVALPLLASVPAIPPSLSVASVNIDLWSMAACLAFAAALWAFLRRYASAPETLVWWIALSILASGISHGIMASASPGGAASLVAHFDKMLRYMAPLLGFALDQIETNVSLRRTRAELRKVNEELERSNRDLDQVADAAAHDLQEPLRLIRSYADLVCERWGEVADAGAREALKYVADSSERMERMVTDLLAFARAGSGSRQPEPTSASEALDGAMANLALSIAESGAIVTADRLPEVKADRTQLVQVFQNLLSNAIRFKGPEPPRIRITARTEDGSWVFSVKDNGVGIDPRKAEDIFVVFHQLDPRAGKPGTGTGLAICRRIVERRGGRIWFDSAPGQGATFHFTIPNGRPRTEGARGAGSAV